MEKRKRVLPDWIKKDFNHNRTVLNLKKDLTTNSLHTVCEEARCPNLSECFKKRTTTFMILGTNCTRNCSFCSVNHGAPSVIDKDEPAKIANMVKDLNLKHVVITSVTRDDLLDGGAQHFVDVINSIREKNSSTIEVLTPDFKGVSSSRALVSSAKPDIYNHNIETVKELYPSVRFGASYEGSLNFLNSIKDDDPSIITKTGIMVGLGETEDQLKYMLEDVVNSRVDIFTCGQYLRPTKNNAKVIEYKDEEWFEKFKIMAESFGIKYVYSSPFMRSSYNAGDVLEEIARSRSN
ncbi:MAG: lipoyl synthase [Candidatus Cloacimonadota bacterium]|nr:MAG: lipoyl synthase [Candidatus Cloacimonadota bacterium]PIE77495.1 MAG: lipoyl synthase [Candidatus Delongbacteria bacterium]